VDDTPPDRSGLIRAQKLGITAGRRAGCGMELEAALRAHGLAEGTEDWTDAVRAGCEAMKLTQQREARTMCVMGSDGEWVPDEDYRAAAAMKVEQL